MGRSRLIASIVILMFVGGLVVVRYGPGTGTTTAAAPNEPNTTEATEEPTPSEPTATESSEPPAAQTLTNAPPVFRPAPELNEIDGWFHTENDSLSDFDGQVKIVQFWTYSCHNCTATIPFLQDIYETHQPNGLEIVGVHSPEFDFEKDPAGIAQASKDLGVTWPVARDTDKKNFRAWQEDRRFWPRTYVVDQVGNIRYDHIGEGSYDELDQTVAWLLENGP